MVRTQLRFLFLLSPLILLSLSAGSAQASSVFTRNREATTAVDNLSFCQKVEVSRAGAICESPYGFTARLDFPAVNVESVLSGKEVFPNTEASYFAENQVIDGVHYRNIVFVLRWESTTPDFLQIYLKLHPIPSR